MLGDMPPSLPCPQANMRMLPPPREILNVGKIYKVAQFCTDLSKGFRSSTQPTQFKVFGSNTKRIALYLDMIGLEQLKRSQL
jgi:hypothetical protein